MKRFTETQKWEDTWYRKLGPTQKLLWQWICDKCDAAGVIEPDWDLASFQIGENVDEAMLSDFGTRVVALPSGKFHVVKFVQFQYGKLSRACKPHAPVFAALARHGMTGDEVAQNEAFRELADDNIRRKVIERDGKRCIYFDRELQDDEIAIDHVHPRSKGGTATLDNLVVASKEANIRKWDFSAEEFCRAAGLDWKAVAQRISKATGKPIEAFRAGDKGYLGSLKEKEKDKDTDKDKDLCTLEQAKSYAPMVRLTPEEAEFWWHTRKKAGWTISSAAGSARKITSWQSDMATAVDWVKERAAKRKAGSRPESNLGDSTSLEGL